MPYLHTRTFIYSHKNHGINSKGPGSRFESIRKKIEKQIIEANFEMIVFFQWHCFSSVLQHETCFAAKLYFLSDLI